MSSSAVAELSAAVQDFASKSKAELTEMAQEVQTNKAAKRSHLFHATFAYFGLFGAVALVLPSLGVTAYGADTNGDGDASADYVRSLGVFQVALAVLAVFASKWPADGEPAKQILKVFALFYVLAAANNLYLVLYGSIRSIVLLNAVVDGALAYFHMQHAGLMPRPHSATD